MPPFGTPVAVGWLGMGTRSDGCSGRCPTRRLMVAAAAYASPLDWMPRGRGPRLGQGPGGGAGAYAVRKKPRTGRAIFRLFANVVGSAGVCGSKRMKMPSF